MKTIFAFDLDGTITLKETLPELAKDLGRADEFAAITQKTVAGLIPFAESFAERVNILREVPLKRAREIMAAIPLNCDIAAFITAHSDICAVVTGNIDLWAAPVVAKLNCPLYSSTGFIDSDGKVRLKSIIDKAQIVRRLAATPARVVAVGDGAGDIAMLKAADFAIAYAGIHTPPPALAKTADCIVDDGKELRDILEKFFIKSF